ncbi:MAG: T9SS type A sorting domain-containing protein [Hymenobacter sp.]|nr:MAG: T9SS type A sorting domain-containing protein [Hymenobacter sp.]
MGFGAIGQVPSAQPRHYQLLDSGPDLLKYYRLRQVALDGTETLGPVVAVRADPATAALAAYPSPATALLTVRGPVGTSFRLADQAGRRVGGATITAARSPQLDVRSLPAGVYFVQDAATGNSIRFVKANQ